ncbi:MAG: hypothetical protein ACXACY_17335 [Candidatus Hodarchaeales archaeon]|jgi:hypothetical protein
MIKKIDYNARNFSNVRQQLIEFIQKYYPEIFSDFNDASVGMMLLELNAAVGDMLSFHTDRMFNETQLSYAQEKSSVLEMARTFGLNVPGNRPSITIVDWTVNNIPVKGDTFDIQYAPIIKKGAQALGAGRVFELSEDSDFTSPFTTGGIPNRLIVPNIDGSGVIQNYSLTKREIMLNGFTKIYKRTLNKEDYKPFFEIVLPEDNVLSIENIITKEGTNIITSPTPSDFANFNLNWYEVPALAQAEIYIEDVNSVSDRKGIKVGKWKNSPRRFIKEFTDNGFCKITFGSGDADISELNDFVGCRGQIDRIGKKINNLSLGEIPQPSNTLYVKYRIGGGTDSNIGPNVINGLGIDSTPVVDGPVDATNQIIKNSVSVNNPIPALGGKSTPSIDEIRNLIRYNFSSQNRCVTIKDYQSRIPLMPGQFGVPFRSGVWEERNKINVSIIALDQNGKLSNESTSTLKQNIAEYLADYRMLNDFVVVKNGRVINLGFEIDLFIEKAIPKGEVITDVITSVKNYFDINKWDMGDNIYLSQLVEDINNVGGVLNVTDLRVYNKVNKNGKYSLNEIAQPYLDEDTKQIDLLGRYTLFGAPNSMFEIKYPNEDIKVTISTS